KRRPCSATCSCRRCPSARSRRSKRFYAGYSVRPTSGEWDDVYATFDPDRADFLRRVLASGKEGRIWTGVDPDAVPGEERERVIKALGYLEQQGLVELKVADVRQRFTLLTQPPSLDEL